MAGMPGGRRFETFDFALGLNIDAGTQARIIATLPAPGFEVNRPGAAFFAQRTFDGSPLRVVRCFIFKGRLRGSQRGGAALGNAE